MLVIYHCSSTVHRRNKDYYFLNKLTGYISVRKQPLAEVVTLLPAAAAAVLWCALCVEVSKPAADAHAVTDGVGRYLRPHGRSERSPASDLSAAPGRDDERRARGAPGCPRVSETVPQQSLELQRAAARRHRLRQSHRARSFTTACRVQLTSFHALLYERI